MLFMRGAQSSAERELTHAMFRDSASSGYAQRMSHAMGAAAAADDATPRRSGEILLPSNLKLTLRQAYRGAKSQRRSAWEEFLVALQPFARQVALVVLKGNAGAQIDTDDFAHDVIAGFWQSYGDTKEQVPKGRGLTLDRVIPILMAIAANKLAAHCARLERERAGLSEIDLDLVMRTSPSASQWARGREFRKALGFLLDRELGASDRKIFELRAVDNLTFEEIITRLRLKCGPEALRKKVQRMRRKLRRMLSPELLSWLSGPRLKARKIARPDRSA